MLTFKQYLIEMPYQDSFKEKIKNIIREIPKHRKDGYDIVFHGSDAAFNKFDPLHSSEAGFHFAIDLDGTDEFTSSEVMSYVYICGIPSEWTFKEIDDIEYFDWSTIKKILDKDERYTRDEFIQYMLENYKGLYYSNQYESEGSKVKMVFNEHSTKIKIFDRIHIEKEDKS